MTVNRALHAVAGTMILASLALAHFASPYFLWLTVFVGANLLQSAFTNRCLMVTILRKLGLKDG